MRVGRWALVVFAGTAAAIAQTPAQRAAFKNELLQVTAVQEENPTPRRASAAAAMAQTAAERVEAFNSELLQATGAPGQYAAPRQASSGSLPETIAARAESLKMLIETDPKRALELALPDSALAVLRAAAPGAAANLEQRGSWSGQAEVAVADSFDTHSSRTIVTVQADTSLSVYFATGQPAGLKSGALLSVQGIRLGDSVAVERAAVYGSVFATTSDCERVTGEQRIAVILVTFPGLPAPNITTSELRDYFFGTTGPSLDGYWRENSYGKTWATGDVFGPYQLNRAYTCSETDKMRAAAIAAADYDVDFRNYSRIYIYFPEPSGCGWTGLGTIGCGSVDTGDGAVSMSTVWVSTPNTSAFPRDVALFVEAHEGGHNLGLLHAKSRDFGSVALGAPGQVGNLDEYGDYYSIMGYGLGHYNAQNKVQLGWLDASEVATIDDYGSQRILPIESQAPGIKALKIRRSPGSDDWLWFEYHQPLSPYSLTWPPYLDYTRYSGAAVHLDDAYMRSPEQAPATALLDFTPNSQDGGNDFLDARFAGDAIWADLYSTRMIRAGPANDDGIVIEAALGGSCASLTETGRDFGPGQGSGTFEVSASPSCAWSVATPDDWITLNPPVTGVGPGVVSYTVAANTTGPARTGTITVGQSTYTITQATSLLPPSDVYVSPTSGAGPIADLEFAYADPNGVSDMAKVAFNLTAGDGLANGCAVELDLATGWVRIADDAGNWSEPGPEPGPYSPVPGFSNSQCAPVSILHGIGTGPEGQNISLSVSIQLTTTEQRQLKIMLLAEDKEGNSSGWAQRGTWIAEPNSAPSAATVTPINGTGINTVFTLTVTDPNGAPDIASAGLRFMRAGGAYCEVRARGMVMMGVTSGDGWQETSTITPRLLESQNCSLDVNTSYSESAGNSISVRFFVKFKDSLAGPVQVTATATDRAGATLSQTLGQWTVAASPDPPPVFQADGVVNGASFKGGGISGGELITIFGTNLGPPSPAYSTYIQGSRLQRSVAGTEVYIDGALAPLIYTSSTQVAAIVPYTQFSYSERRIRVQYQGRLSENVSVPVANTAPALFTTEMGGSGQAVAVNCDDSTSNSATNPARRGSLMTIFMTGEGLLWAGWPDGMIPLSGAGPRPVATPTITFGGVPAQIDFIGLIWPGITQINVRVPVDAPAGVVPVVVSSFGNSSPNTVTVALK